ncbi:hypothetical protein HB364_28010 [Pseudoflavitalea sp. X16]|uniref:hypothetical protein n=1 Tax=Paraflavitalea devenefica TaxID=2716334 RepID=UPI00141E3605|nr:hypothetical protein [Paraflavitalea devenefica]NII28956.1 hypothetical protein [Paraflavitalea devenefica]
MQVLDYILLNKKKVWGLVIFFLAIFAVLTIVNRTSYDSSLQKIWVNAMVSVALSSFGYVVFLLGAFIDFKRATALFNSPPFKALTDKGFNTELTAVNSRFLFAGKRLVGSVNDFPVKIGGASKRFNVYIGIDERITDKVPKKQLVSLLKPKGLTFEGIFVERLVVQESNDGDEGAVWNLISELTDFLKANGFEPRRRGQQAESSGS